jgi:CheY-like chemotaxis protein
MSAPTPPDPLATMRRDLHAAIKDILAFTKLLQQQAEDLAEETFLPDLQKIHGVGKHFTALLDELVGESLTRLEDVDFPRLRFEIRTALNHTVGYVEMLHERAHELQQLGLLRDLDKVLDACRQLLVHMEAAAQQAGDIPAPSGNAPRRSGADENTSPGGTLLVVDDNLQSRELLGRELRRLGYHVVQAGSGPSAMERIRADNFDLILLDVVMPGMNGYEVLQWLKADATLQHIPVLMISALNDTENVVRCLVIGADDYITKPFEPILLKVRVLSCLERNRWRRLEESYLRQIEEARSQSERVLLNMLPQSTVCPS